MKKQLKYREPGKLDLVAFEQEVLKFWAEQNIFHKSVANRPDDNEFVFYEGPPSANGMPGIHHVLSRTVKDIFCRYKTLQGFKVVRKGGWDTHGLPVELGVEKMLGITKDDIGSKVSVEEFNAICRKEVMKYKDAWSEMTERMGYWVDLDDPYITFENEYIEVLWSLLKRLYDQKYLYKGYSIQPYSPTDGTGLSSHELNLPGCYKDVKDTSVVAQFKIKNPQQLHSGDLSLPFYFLAWTTTPWTLPGNCALAVGKKIDYVAVQTINQYTSKPIVAILARELVEKFFNPDGLDIPITAYKPGDKLIPWKTISDYKGEDLIGIKYEQLLPYVQPKEQDGWEAFRVIAGDFVSTEEGTGIVHTASVFGADDYRVCQQNKVPSILVEYPDGSMGPVVDKHGQFTPEITDFAGMYVREEYYSDEERVAEDFDSTDLQIALKLKEENKAFKIEKYVHSYPHSWRTDKPVLYYPLDSWFIKTTAFKERMVELNNTINWQPPSTGEGRFGNWLENLVDWNLSRSRFWGTPLPIWRTEDGSEEVCIGSIVQLSAECDKSVVAGHMDKNPFKADEGQMAADLHRPYVDQIVLTSPSGKKMLREPDLIDVWFDSGAMPYAQYPKLYVNNEVSLPADYIAEGVDQTRGWFFTLHALAVMLSDSVAYKNVISHGLVLDKNGNKMSKRLGNSVDPFEALSTYGADAIRWYMISNSLPWENVRFDSGAINEVRKSFFGTLYNTYAFFALYANIDGFEIDEQNVVPVSERPELDRWIISKLHSLVREVTAAYDDYHPTKAARAIAQFLDDHLSNWYVRLSRRRFWKGEMGDDKRAAYETLFECLTVVAQLMSPVAPFFADWMYKNLTDTVRQKAIDNETPLRFESVHLTNLVQPEQAVIDHQLERRMELAQTVSSLVLSLRKKENIRVRQPLSKVMIPVLDHEFAQDLDHVEELIRSEVNVKAVEPLKDAGVFTKKIKPDYKRLGSRLGKQMKAVAQALAELRQEDILKFEQDEKWLLQLNGSTAELTLEDVEIATEDMPGLLVAQAKGVAVALDVTLTDDLRAEGDARELVNRVQKLRKERGFDVTDRIVLHIEAKGSLAEAVKAHKPYICSEILATELRFEGNLSQPENVEISGIEAKIDIERAKT